jgi:hypothetical protein
MRLLKVGVCITLAGLIGAAASGCMATPLNDLISAGLKIANNQMSQLTASEVKALSDAAVTMVNSQTGGAGQSLTDAQAAAVVEFLVANQINSPQDIEGVIRQGEADHGSVPGLAELAAAFGLDPNDPDPGAVRHVFEVILGIPLNAGEPA